MDLVNNRVMELSTEVAEGCWRREAAVMRGLNGMQSDLPFPITELIDHIGRVLESGDSAGALGILATVLESPDGLSVENCRRLRLIEAEIQLASGNFRNAERGFRKVVDDFSALPGERDVAQLKLAEALASAGEYSAAIEALPLGASTHEGEGLASEYGILVTQATYHNFAGNFSTALKILAEARGGEQSAAHAIDSNIQEAWALTHSGRFSESDRVLIELGNRSEYLPNAGLLIRAWNKVGSKGESFGNAIQSFAEYLRPERSKRPWESEFYRAWQTFGKGEYEKALGQFQALRTSTAIVPSLTASVIELKLMGEAVCQAKLNNRSEARAIFWQYAFANPDASLRVHLPRIIAGLSHTSLSLSSGLSDSGSSLKTASLTRRRAQVSLGHNSAVAARIMNLEAVILLSQGQPDHARTVCAAALVFVQQESPSPKDELLLLFGISLIEVYEGNSDVALEVLASIGTRAGKVLGNNHELSLIVHLITQLLDQMNEPESNDDFLKRHEALVQQVTELSPMSLTSLRQLGNQLFASERFDKAMVAYNLLKGMTPATAGYTNFRGDVDRRIGECHRAMGRYSSALDSFESALTELGSSEQRSAASELEVQISLNECRIKSGSYRSPMRFFSLAAADLRQRRLELTPEYFRTVRGYASCLEYLGNYEGAAHNYGHLVRLVETELYPCLREVSADIFVSAAWNNEQARKYGAASSLYQKAYEVLEKESSNEERRLDDILHRRNVCHIAAQT